MIQSDLGGHVPKLEDQPWPAFPADTMSIALVTATQCKGLILIHEKMFESRLFFVDKLVGDGRAHRAVRSASRARRRTVAAARRHRRVARHSRRHGDAARRAAAPTARARSTTSGRSSAATSASTSGCARSARGSSASRSGGRNERSSPTPEAVPGASTPSAFARSRRRERRAASASLTDEPVARRDGPVVGAARASCGRADRGSRRRRRCTATRVLVHRPRLGRAGCASTTPTVMCRSSAAPRWR